MGTAKRQSSQISPLKPLQQLLVFGNQLWTSWSATTFDVKNDAGMDARLPIGAGYVVVGVLLTIAYVGVAELIQQRRLPVSPALDAVFIVWYVILYSVFALEMWQMTWRAYQMRDREIDLPILVSR